MKKGPPADILATEASVASGMAFKPKPEDVFITTYPKCGTTWVSQICHVLRSEGDMNFTEIEEVIPWDMMALDCGVDLSAASKYTPKLIKSHFPWTKIAKGGKYIHVVRDPVDVLRSFYYFFLGFTHLTEEKMPFEKYFKAIFMGPANKFGNVFDFYSSYLAADGDILWVFYEDIEENPAHEISRMAKFIGLESTLVPEELAKRCELAKDMSSKEYMLANTEKFDGSFIFEARKKRLAAKGVEIKKPTQAKVASNAKREISPQIMEALNNAWKEKITKKFGHASYQEMREKIHR